MGGSKEEGARLFSVVHKLKYRKFCLNIQGTLFTVCVGKHWNRLPGSVVEVVRVYMQASLQVFKN